MCRPGSCQLDDSWQPGAISRLFEKELDNHHEEKLLVAQLAAQQLAHLLQRQQGSSAREQNPVEAREWVLGCLQVSAPCAPTAMEVCRTLFLQSSHIMPY